MFICEECGDTVNGEPITSNRDGRQLCKACAAREELAPVNENEKEIIVSGIDGDDSL